MANDTMTKFLGGSPLAVLTRLILVSVLVGVILSALGLDPFDIVRSIRRLIVTIWDMGFDAVHWLWRVHDVLSDRVGQAGKKTGIRARQTAGKPDAVVSGPRCQSGDGIEAGLGLTWQGR